MKKSEFAEYYKIMFSDYPEMLKCCEVQTMLGVSRHAVYRLLKDGCIRHLRIGKRMIRVPKANVIRYLIDTKAELPAEIAV